MNTIEQTPISDAAIKDMVREKYSAIATQSKDDNAASCCGATECCAPDGKGGTYSIMADSYEKLHGYNPDADLGLGCGLPTEYARLRPGDTVLDLGSGAGNDCFVARAEVGDTGRVIGVDFSLPMLEKARANAEKLGYINVEFREGDIESLPVDPASVDVVVSNCVLNLVPNKARVFAEIRRVLRDGGHFSISDVVKEGDLPKALNDAAELYVGCVSGALQKSDYLALIEAAGFENIRVEKQKPILIPDAILEQYADKETLDVFRTSGASLQSITVYARKAKAQACCAPGSSCC